MRDYLAIIRRNFFSPIVLAIFLLAGALIYVGEHRDAWFVSVVIILNSLIGVVQELRAKQALRKLELMAAPKARLWQGGVLVEVAYDSLSRGDEIELRAGDEVPVDGKVLKDWGLEVDEGMLTGESAAIEKDKGDDVYGATVVLAGSARVVVTAIGTETKAGAMSKKLKRYEPELTPLQRAIRLAISVLTFGAMGLAILIFVVYSLADQDSVTILKTITSAAVTVVPEGLLLASSLLLALGSLKLAKVKVLPQKLSAIEAMALLNLLCVDKTGTLTSDEIVLDDVIAFVGHRKNVQKLAALVAKEASGGNATGSAIMRELTPPTEYDVREIMAFSSVRRMSAVRARVGDKVRTVFMGAPEHIASLVSLSSDQRQRVEAWASEGRRVLLLAEIDDTRTALKDIAQAKGAILGAVLLTNNLRSGVHEAVAYLQKQGVSMRVISGDNPKTVQYVASQAGIYQSEKSITGVQLAKMTDVEFAEAADEHVIFARVLPEQKQKLIAHFRAKGSFTGMVGDGVNDALALKEADLGVAMYAGATVSRRVADIVLLNNSFTSLPLGMRLGHRIMQAIEIIATLFFHKIIYGIVLLGVTMLLGMKYPFEPRHITFMNIYIVTLPTLMWTVFPPLPRNRVNPNNFWRDTLIAIAPIAIITGLTVTFTYWAMSFIYPDRQANVATMTVLVATFFGVYMVFLVAKMLGVKLNRRAKRARLLYVVIVVSIALFSFGAGFLRDFFDFSTPTVWMLWPALGTIMLAAVVQWRLVERRGRSLIL